MGRAVTEADARVGALIATARRAKGLSQTALAQAAGVTFQQVQKYEKGRNRVASGRLVAIARALGMDAADLLRAADDAQAPVIPDLPKASLTLAAMIASLPPRSRDDITRLVEGMAARPHLAA